MPSNDKISLMTAATAGNLAGSTTGVEVSSLMTTVPVTYSATLALLRTTMFAGGTGYTATDPITAGAASFTTLAASGAVNFGANSLTAGAASFTTGAFSGAVELSSTLAVTGASTLTGNVGIGGVSSASQGLTINSAALTGTTQYGASFAPVFTSGATVQGRVLQVLVATAAAVYTMPLGYGIHVQIPTVGAGSAITTIYGVNVANQGAAGITNAYGVYIAAQSGAATTNIGIYNGGTTQLVGAVGISSAPVASTMFAVGGSVVAIAGRGYSLYTGTSVAASANSDLLFNARLDPTFTNAGAYTGLVVYGLYVNAFTPPANTSSAYGIRVNSITGTTTTNAYGMYVEAPTGASSVNRGIYNGGDSHFVGSVGVGVAPIASEALYVGTTTLTGASQYGVDAEPLFSSAATGLGAAMYAQLRTTNAAFTMGTGVALQIASPNIGAGSAVTNAYGIRILNQGAAGITDAYGIHIAAQSGAATTNIGLYNAGTTTLVGNVSMTGNFNVTGAASTQAAGVLSIGGTQQTTVGAAGGASALPATPSGYIKTYIGSTQFVIPYYAQA